MEVSITATPRPAGRRVLPKHLLDNWLTGTASGPSLLYCGLGQDSAPHWWPECCLVTGRGNLLET